MALKDRWSRMLRKSVSSTSSSGPSDATGLSNDESEIQPALTTAATAPNPPPQRPSGRLAKTFSWRSANGKDTSEAPAEAPAPPKAKSKPKQKQRMHPSERPLTETNLRHQELLSTFTMSFGRRRMSQGGRTSFSGISPGNSRQTSLDSGYANVRVHSHGHGGRASQQYQEGGPMGSVAEESRRE